MGTFTPLVFGTNGGMGSDCQMFLKQLAGKLAEKDQERYAVVIAWLRTRISFEILRAVHVSVMMLQTIIGHMTLITRLS